MREKKNFTHCGAYLLPHKSTPNLKTSEKTTQGPVGWLFWLRHCACVVAIPCWGSFRACLFTCTRALHMQIQHKEFANCTIMKMWIACVRPQNVVYVTVFLAFRLMWPFFFYGRLAQNVVARWTADAPNNQVWQCTHLHIHTHTHDNQLCECTHTNTRDGHVCECTSTHTHTHTHTHINTW